jgi:sporulation protein YlmC with PRC-barrel domain
MLRSLNEIRGYSVLDLDGEVVGQTHDFYFDDVSWVVRYLVVDTGVWLPGRKVLVSSVAISRPDWGGGVSLPVQLTREQVKNSPDIDTDKPISRQQETELHEFYDWPPYWSDVTPFDARAAGMPADTYMETMRAAGKEKPPPAPDDVMEKVSTAEQTGDPHLRSVAEVLDYDIQTTDGEIGHVEDFVVDSELWIIRYMVIDTRDWLPGRKVLVAPQWVRDISWPESQVEVDLTRAEIKDSPEYDPSIPVNRGYEERLYDYYGRPKYWG